jgi:membrane protease YdiL (CAAX protease family)
VSINQPVSLEEPLTEAQPGAPGQAALSHFGSIDPDDPPWGVMHAVLVWVISVALLLFVPLAASIPYVLYRVLIQGSADGLGTDPNLIFISIIAVLPTHILTFLIVWFVVTNRGRRPFWQTLGWSWPETFGPWRTIGLAIALLFLGGLITHLLGGDDTQMDLIIKSSLKTRFATAFLAAATGPFVEELIYRGVLYAAFQRAVGMAWAVVLASALFTGVHVLQYYNNLGVIFVIALLSVTLTLVRARTGRLLPSYVMHLVFNGIQALILIAQPFAQKPTPEKNSAIGFLIGHISRLLT